MDILLIGAALFLSFWNGANDNFKGFATVWGAQTLGYRQALALASAATVAGSLVALFVAESLAAQFSGRGLVPDAVAASPQFMLHAGVGAALTVMVASRLGLPVSTTHALIGGLVGAGFAHAGGDVRLGGLAGQFLLPLLASPLLAAAFAALAGSVRHRFRRDADCACVVAPINAERSGSDAVAAATMPVMPELMMARESECRAAPGVIARFSIARQAESAHILSAALICFARGVNDTPKLAALLLASSVVGGAWSVALIAAAMLAGGLVYARRVAETMSRRVSRMDNGQGLAANLVTATLVLFASKLGMPVSTTHVSVGSIAGIGIAGRSIHWATVRTIALAWAGTLPLAAGFAWGLATLA